MRKDSDIGKNALETEIAFHIEALTEENLAKGMRPAEARRRALIDFGGSEQAVQQMREVHVARWLEALRFHLRTAVRLIRRSPGMSLVIVATLALGVGANTAVFSVLDAVLLKSLPFPDPESLVRIQQHDTKVKAPESLISTQRIEDLQHLSTKFSAITGYYEGDATLTGGEMPERVPIAFVAPRFLQTWGVAPELGRGFRSTDYSFRAQQTVLVTDHFWRTHLNADPGAVGRGLKMSGGEATVVGVLPHSFLLPDPEIDLFMPNPVDAPYTTDRSSTWFHAYGRLKQSVTLPEGEADLQHVAGELARQYPATDGTLRNTLQPLKAVVTGDAGRPIWLLYGSVTLLLLIACINIAALLLARTLDREHETAIRLALGARRRTIAIPVLLETFLLATAGAAAGLILASGTGRLLATTVKNLPRVTEVGLDWRLFGYAGVATLLVTLLCGLLPALAGSRGMQGQAGERPGRSPLARALAGGGQNKVAERGRAQWAFVCVQVVLAVAMLVSAGLLLRSMAALSRVNAGFDTAHVLTLRVSGGWGETANMGRLTARIDRTLDGLRSLPGVRAAATSATLPGNSGPAPEQLQLQEATTVSLPERINADVRYVSPGYFPTMNIPLLLGGECRAGMQSNAAVVNRSFADRFLGGSRAIGLHVKVLDNFGQTAQVVGVAGDAREQGLDAPAVPTLYFCLGGASPDPNYLVRVDGDPAAMAEAVRRRVHELEPARSVFGVMPLEAHLAERGAENRLLTVLLSAFAAMAVLLVCLGLYGTVSYVGRQRRREIGLRLAVGAMPQTIVRRFVLQSLRTIAAAAVAGLLLGAAGARLLAAQLYGVSPTDWATYTGVLLLMVMVGALAAVVPAMRAVRVNPMEIMRAE